VSLCKQARNRWVTEVSQVSLVSLCPSNLRHAPISSAGHWHGHQPRLGATTSAQEAGLRHSLFVTSTLRTTGPTPDGTNGDRKVLKSRYVLKSGDSPLV
jgi:hypothetical protein